MNLTLIVLHSVRLVTRRREIFESLRVLGDVDRPNRRIDFSQRNAGYEKVTWSLRRSSIC
jgi:hypothetical protein